MSSHPTITPTQQIFLSYSRTDRDACIVLRTALQQAGLTVFHDEEAIRTGDRWMTRLEEALQQCSAFVVLIGRDGVQRWVGAEAQTALVRHLSPHDDKERLPIFPILLAEAKPESLPPFLALFQFDRWAPVEPLPDGLLDAIKARLTRIDVQHAIEGCPYLGLSAFGRQDSHLFFGRRKETLEALTYLGDQQQTNPEKLQQEGSSTFIRWVQVEGNSGSGKSSLVNAGMLPMIEQGTLWTRTGFEQWHILGPMMPGEKPIDKLANTLNLDLIDDRSKRDYDVLHERLSAKESGLASTLKNFKQAGWAFLLIIDQFEELFTFAEEAGRKQFDALLANALRDPDCPLFLISTVRADFLDRFEYLPRLREIYNSHCKRYFLPLISESGLREIIEQPARLADLDVSEITTAMLDDAKDEIGALALVENALTTLWHPGKQRLSGDDYRQRGGIAGMLSSQADALLQRIDQTIPKGKQAALELLLRLTHINDQGRHTRQRIPREEAIFIAGNGNDPSGERVLRMLSGERLADTLSAGHHSVLRLITLSQEQGKQYVDLIHETLIRARSRDPQTGKWLGYWPTLYDYIEKNRNRDIYYQQLKYEAEQWQQSKGLARVWNLAFLGLKKYRAVRVAADGPESHFLTWSRRARRALILLLTSITLYGAESYYWTVIKHELPINMMWMQQRFRLGYAPLPELTEKPLPAGSFYMGERNAAFIIDLGEHEKLFGIPGKLVQIAQPFYLGKYEVTYEQFDYYVWYQQHTGNEVVIFPTTAKGGRANRPVVNVNWHEATAYAAWLGEQTVQKCRLPTEAEWEYSARAGTQTAYPWGDDLGNNHANCADCGSQWDNDQSAPVGSFAANQFGLHDMSGNVWEWTCSAWRVPYDGQEQQCTNLENTENRVLRGGSWLDSPIVVRSAARDRYHPNARLGDVGFRVLCSSPIE